MNIFDKIIALVLYIGAWLSMLVGGYVSLTGAWIPRVQGAEPWVPLGALVYTLVPSAMMFIFAHTLLPNKLVLRGYLATSIIVSFLVIGLQFRSPIG